MECVWCGSIFDSAGSRGRVKRTCSARCRQALSRHRRDSVGRLRAASVGRWVRAVGKRPVMPDGSSASSTDSSTWCSFDDVQGGAGDGFGLMLGGGLACYDFDHALSGGVLKPWARDVLSGIGERVLFAEVSLSGEGLHVFVESGEAPVRRWAFDDGHVEMFSRQRFIRVTLNEFRF